MRARVSLRRLLYKYHAPSSDSNAIKLATNNDQGSAAQSIAASTGGASHLLRNCRISLSDSACKTRLINGNKALWRSLSANDSGIGSLSARLTFSFPA